MTRVLVLLVLVLVVGTYVLFTKVLPEDEGPVAEGGETAWEKVDQLPRLEMQRLSLAEYARRGVDPVLTPKVVAAIERLAIGGGVAFQALNQLSISDKLVLDAVNLLPGTPALTIEGLEAMAREAGLDETATRTLSRDRLLNLDLLRLLAERGELEREDLAAIETVAGLQSVQTNGFQLVERGGGQRTIEVDTELMICGEAGTPLGAIEVFDQRGSLRFRFDAKASQWLAADHFDRPVMVRKMQSVAARLDGLGRAKYVAGNSKSHANFGVAGDEGPRVRLERPDGTVLLDFRVGSLSQTTGQKREDAGTYIRPIGQDQVFLHPRNLLLAGLSSEPRAWIDHRYFGIDHTQLNDELKQVERLVLEYKDEALVPDMPGQPEREWTGTWQRFDFLAGKAEAGDQPGPDQPSGPDPSGMRDRVWTLTEPTPADDLVLGTPMVDNLVRFAISGQGDGIVGRGKNDPKYGFEEPALRVTAHFAGGVTRTLTVGNALTEEDQPSGGGMMGSQGGFRYVSVSGSPFVFRARGHALANFQKRPEDLIDPATRKVPEAAPVAPGPGPILPPEEGGGTTENPPAPSGSGG